MKLVKSEIMRKTLFFILVLSNAQYVRADDFEDFTRAFGPILFIAVLVIIGIFVAKSEAQKREAELEIQKEKQNKVDLARDQYIKELTDSFGTATRIITYERIEDSVSYYDDILVFEKPKIIVFGDRICNFDDVLSCTMYDENQNKTIKQITRTNTGSMLGRAALGGLTLGAAGAVVGALTAKKETDSKDDVYKASYVVKIGIKSLKNPSVILHFDDNAGVAEETYSLVQAVLAMK